MKRGQVTIFIVVGILALLITGIILFIVKDTSEIETVDTSSVESVKLFVDSCLQDASTQAMRLVSMQGGYNTVPEPSQNFVFLDIPYYFDQGQGKVPTKARIEHEMSEYVSRHVENCLDFSIFEEFEIKEGEMNVDVQLTESSVFALTLPLMITQGDIITELDRFEYSLPVNFEHVHAIIQDVIREHQLNPNYVPMGHLSVLAQDEEFTFEISYLDDDVVVYSFVFDQYQVDRKQYVFAFGSKYNWSHLGSEGRLEYVQDVEDQYCYVTDPCSYNMNIYDDPYLFEDFTDLFDITENGRIDFVSSTVGNHSVLIKISHEGSEEFHSFIWEVRELPIVE